MRPVDGPRGRQAGGSTIKATNSSPAALNFGVDDRHVELRLGGQLLDRGLQPAGPLLLASRCRGRPAG